MTQSATLIRAATPAASVDVARRYAEFIASTEAVDSHGTIVRQNWNLERYRKNPIVLWNHCTDDPIGTAEVRLDNGQLIAGVTFAEGTEDADEVWALVQQGVLRAVSVGFRPAAFDLVEMGDDFVVVYDAPELYELSVVSIPSNPDALARAYAHSASAEQEIRRAALARRTHKENSMATETQKPATPSETAPAASESRAAETINKEAHDLVVKSLHQTIAEREAVIAKVTAECDELRKEACAAKAEKLEAKVRSFVNKKITEANVDEFLALARSSETAFDLAIKAMPDLGFKVGEQIAKPEQATRGATGEDAKQAFIDKRTQERMRDLSETKMVAMRAAMHEAAEKGL